MPANNEEIQEGKDETENEAKGGISGCGVQLGPVTSPFKVPLKGGAVTDRRVAPSDAEAARLHRSDPQHSQQPRRARARARLQGSQHTSSGFVYKR